jgi:hypothetical protein
VNLSKGLLADLTYLFSFREKLSQENIPSFFILVTQLAVENRIRLETITNNIQTLARERYYKQITVPFSKVHEKGCKTYCFITVKIEIQKY